MVYRIVAALYFIFVIFTSLIFFGIAVCIRLVTYPFDKRLVALHQFTSFWGVFYIWMMPAWSLKTTGREKLDRKQTYVIVSNHQSQLDILASFSIFFPFKWVSKIEVFSVPVMGWNMRMNRYIKLDRGKRGSIKTMLEDSRKALSAGSSVFFFPEGTRSQDGELRSFKPGAFKIAQEMNLPILPVAINGTKDALPKGSANFHGKQKMTIDILDAITPDQYEGLNPQEIADLTRSKISNHFASINENSNR